MGDIGAEITKNDKISTGSFNAISPGSLPESNNTMLIGTGRTEPLIVPISETPNVSKPDDFESLLQSLSSYPDAQPILATYSEIGESADQALVAVEHALSGIRGASVLGEAARDNMEKQARIFLRASDDILKKGYAVVPVFGRYELITDLDDIDGAMQQIFSDFNTVADQVTDFRSFTDFGLEVIDKYLFDGRNIERVKDNPANILILKDGYDRNDSRFTERLKRNKIITNDPVDPTLDDDELPYPYIRVETLYESSFSYLDPRYSIPDIVIVQATSQESLDYNLGFIQLRDEYDRLPPEQRPVVILHSDGEALVTRHRHAFQGFLFSHTMDDLRNSVYTAKDLLAAREEPDFLNPVLLSDLSRKLYDSVRLRDWEHETADTYQALRQFLLFIERRTNELNAMPSDEKGYLSQLNLLNPHKTLLDMGTGEGRMAIMLARLGYKVLGVDLSQNQLDRAAVRIREEGEGLRGEADHPGLSYHALKRLQTEGVAPADIILDDDTVKKRYLTAKADFQYIQKDLTKLIQEWHDHYPDIRLEDFFAIDMNSTMPIDMRNPFMDFGFDGILFDWHTWYEGGGLENQAKILEQCFNLLGPGGFITFSIADRTVGPYATIINDYHERHPDEPYGTVRDSPPTNPGEVVTMHEDASEDTPRFFTDRDAFIKLLREKGFEIDPTKDIQTYLITSEDPNTGETVLQAKELYITAFKPLFV